MHNKENYNNNQTGDSSSEWEGIGKTMQTANNGFRNTQTQTTPDIHNNEQLTPGQREFLKEQMRKTLSEGYKNDGRLPKEYYDLTKKVLDKMESEDNNK